MKINGCSRNPEYIEIKHSGYDITYRHSMRPIFIERQLEEPVTLELEFADMKEIDNLIHILVDYRKRCDLHVGGYIPPLELPYPCMSMEELDKQLALAKLSPDWGDI